MSEATEVEVPRETELAGPEPIASGRFKLFPTPAGGLHLTYSLEGSPEGPEERHFELSPLMMKMMKRGPWGKALGV